VTILDAPSETPPALWGNASHIATEQSEPLASWGAILSCRRGRRLSAVRRVIKQRSNLSLYCVGETFGLAGAQTRTCEAQIVAQHTSHGCDCRSQRCDCGKALLGTTIQSLFDCSATLRRRHAVDVAGSNIMSLACAIGADGIWRPLNQLCLSSTTTCLTRELLELLIRSSWLGVR
jgi:hypothetical protein